MRAIWTVVKRYLVTLVLTACGAGAVLWMIKEYSGTPKGGAILIPLVLGLLIYGLAIPLGGTLSALVGISVLNASPEESKAQRWAQRFARWLLSVSASCLMMAFVLAKAWGSGVLTQDLESLFAAAWLIFLLIGVYAVARIAAPRKQAPRRALSILPGPQYSPGTSWRHLLARSRQASEARVAIDKAPQVGQPLANRLEDLLHAVRMLRLAIDRLR